MNYRGAVVSLDACAAVPFGSVPLSLTGLDRQLGEPKLVVVATWCKICSVNSNFEGFGDGLALLNRQSLDESHSGNCVLGKQAPSALFYMIPSEPSKRFQLATLPSLYSSGLVEGKCSYGLVQTNLTPPEVYCAPSPLLLIFAAINFAEVDLCFHGAIILQNLKVPSSITSYMLGKVSIPSDERFYRGLLFRANLLFSPKNIIKVNMQKILETKMRREDTDPHLVIASFQAENKKFLPEPPFLQSTERREDGREKRQKRKKKRREEKRREEKRREEKRREEKEKRREEKREKRREEKRREEKN
ncbi:hypothetical protein DUI87_18284 [Hirundo rustica rustica]|uniref:Uncharacterized protein n=1 Tax=Hirundo rustica rustica TaxID=333673 RepID=A0A3M0JVQ0_HIRRU|nr:hypothetical protein DUI87_18284 [Hirundo rustica rustica]